MKRPWNTKKVAARTLIIACVLGVIVNRHLLVQLSDAIDNGDRAMASEAVLTIFLFGLFWAVIASAICAARNRFISKSAKSN